MKSKASRYVIGRRRSSSSASDVIQVLLIKVQVFLPPNKSGDVNDYFLMDGCKGPCAAGGTYSSHFSQVLVCDRRFSVYSITRYMLCLSSCGTDYAQILSFRRYGQHCQPNGVDRRTAEDTNQFDNQDVSWWLPKLYHGGKRNDSRQRQRSSPDLLANCRKVTHSLTRYSLTLPLCSILDFFRQ